MEHGALDAGRAIGVAVLKKLENDAGMLSDLYVTPSHRGRVFGRRLLEHIVTVARRERLVRLHLEPPSAFADATRLYEGLGWKRGPDLPPVEGPMIGPDCSYILDLVPGNSHV